jgi:hypothetical protein
MAQCLGGIGSFIFVTDANERSFIVIENRHISG